jgi:hypothetical protein
VAVEQAEEQLLLVLTDLKLIQNLVLVAVAVE